MFIGYLQGTLAEREAGAVTVVAGGVGYELRVPAGTFDALGATGSVVTLWVQTSVKKDAIELFGFGTQRERALFRLLVSVPKVGPALALLLMSALPPEELARAVRAGDLSSLVRIKGIGRKTAETLLFHLKDRALEIAAAESLPAPSRTTAAAPSDELVAALVSLGYRPGQAADAAREARGQLPDGDLATLLRKALNVIAALPAGAAR